MDKFSVILDSINWVFASVIILGGHFWGSKYIRLSKSAPLNFLGFATGFAIIWVGISYWAYGLTKNDVANLFITYLVVTSLYELFIKAFLEWVTKFIPGASKEITTKEAVDTFEKVTGDKVVDKNVIPDETKKP